MSITCQQFLAFAMEHDIHLFIFPRHVNGFLDVDTLSELSVWVNDHTDFIAQYTGVDRKRIERIEAFLADSPPWDDPQSPGGRRCQAIEKDGRQCKARASSCWGQGHDMNTFRFGIDDRCKRHQERTAMSDEQKRTGDY